MTQGTQEHVELSQPTSVRRAAKLLWVSLAVGLLATAVSDYWYPLPPAEFVWVVGLQVVVIAGVYAGLIVLATKRHNWARWGLVIFLVITWMNLVLGLPSLISQGYATAFSTGLSTILESYGVYLLFTTESAQWFARAQKSPAVN
jgi:hypothetical protein